MRVNSLSFRLVASSAIISIIMLAIAAFLLNSVFQQALERNFDQRLHAALDGILANVEMGTDGKPKLQSPIADQRFTLPLSGWYWQISSADNSKTLLASGSLLEQHIDLPNPANQIKKDADGTVSFATLDGEGKQLRVIVQRVSVLGQDFSFLVAGNFDELKAEVAAFRNTLLTVLAMLGVGLLMAILAQVRFALQPLTEMQHALNDIRGGRVEMLHDNFPGEIQPVADELNLLMQSNFEIIDRARMQVGNLAHALKTPISILTNEARDSKVALADKVIEQVDVMRDQVNLYLDRARRAARAQTIGSATEVEPVMQSLARTLMRINRDRDLKITVDVPQDLRFRGERQDLEEMVGNVLDNACKWAKSEISVRGRQLGPGAEDGRPWLLLTIDDDGPGIPAHRRAEALRRGQRLDESKPGSGLGMSIITETAAMYGGTVDLAESKTSGLQFNLKLPSIAV